jgi:hypothetical protein
MLLAASVASAQTVVQIKPPPPPEPPIGFIFELKMGTLIPRVGDEPGLSSNPYETIFGNKSMLFGGGRSTSSPGAATGRSPLASRPATPRSTRRPSW